MLNHICSDQAQHTKFEKSPLTIISQPVHVPEHELSGLTLELQESFQNILQIALIFFSELPKLATIKFKLKQLKCIAPYISIIKINSIA